MKRALALLSGMMICASVARGGDVKITAVTATGPKDKPTTIFTPETPEVWALLEIEGAKKGDKLRSVWIADDVGDAAPPNTMILEKTVIVEGDIDAGNLSCTKPAKGWSAGKYHLDLYANDKLAATAKFTVEAAPEKTEKEQVATYPNGETAAGPKLNLKAFPETKEAEPIGSPGSFQYAFKVRNANVQRITKLLTSEDGKKYLEFDIGRGIDVGETVTLNWDKSTNKSGCEWYLKAVYADKSVGEAVRFNFCEEDLIIEF